MKTHLYIILSLVFAFLGSVLAQVSVTDHYRYGDARFAEIAVSPDGSSLAGIEGFGSRIVLFDRSGIPLAVFNEGAGTSHIAFTPDSQSLFALSKDSELLAFDVATETLRSKTQLEDFFYNNLIAAPDGRTAYIFGKDDAQDVYLLQLDLMIGATTGKTLAFEQASVSFAEVRADGSIYAIATSSSGKTWNPSLELLASESAAFAYSSARQDSGDLLSISANQDGRYLSLNGDALSGTLCNGAFTLVTQGSSVAVTGRDCPVYVANLETGKTSTFALDDDLRNRTIRFANDGKTLLVTNRTGISVIDTQPLSEGAKSVVETLEFGEAEGLAVGDDLIFSEAEGLAVSPAISLYNQSCPVQSGTWNIVFQGEQTGFSEECVAISAALSPSLSMFSRADSFSIAEGEGFGTFIEQFGQGVVESAPPALSVNYKNNSDTCTSNVYLSDVDSFWVDYRFAVINTTSIVGVMEFAMPDPLVGLDDGMYQYCRVSVPIEIDKQ